MLTAYAVIFCVALGASVLTFFSGFGLGTILTPVMAIYFDFKVALAATAIVHFTNNIFKVFLLYKNINKQVFFKFAVPALVGSALGALLLTSVNPVILYQYTAFNKTNTIVLQNLLVAVLILALCVLEWLPNNYFNFSEKYVVPGGLLTGFAGGFTGMQGAIRSSFLINLNLSKEAFVATGTAISIVIDFCRILMYLFAGKLLYAMTNSTLVLVGIAGAIIGALVGKQLLHKTTFGVIKLITTACIVVFALLLATGIIK